MDYEALLRARVLAPLGLTSTAIALTPDQARRVAAGHDRYLKPVETWNLVTLPASGALRSTANDLLTFVAANLGYVRTPLAAAMLLQRTTRHPNGITQMIAWGVGAWGTYHVAKHEGGKEGYRSAVVFCPETRSGVVVLINARAGEPMALALHLLTGRALPPVVPPPTAPSVVTLDRKLLDAYAGRYRLPSGSMIEVARRGDTLLASAGTSGVSPFVADGPRSFFSGGDLRMTFEVDAVGRSARLALSDTSSGESETATRVDD
jgi:CubicO group peptidase (beta-lactamase class C family)